ncbi:MAG: PD-(D/E)XK nuclease family protein [Armatimonadaceae bacterium]
MARKFVISPTKIRTFHQCAAKYKLEYIDKVGRFYHRAQAGYSFGHSLHRALDAFHNAGGAENVPVETLTASLDQLWVQSGYKDSEQEQAYREEAVRILQQYHAAHEEQVKTTEEAPPPPQLLFTEKSLRMDLSPEVALSGRVDRVDEHHDGSLEIVDYKSGRDSVSEEDVARSLAMNIYQLLLKHKMPDRRVFATLVALRTGQRASWELDAVGRDELASECLETAETLRNKDWENVLPVQNDHCPYCDFLPHCTRFWKRQNRNMAQ